MAEWKAGRDEARHIAVNTAILPEAASLWSSHVPKQFEILTEQSKELAALSQKIASSSEPITRSFGKPLQGS